VVATVASDNVIIAVLSLYDGDVFLHPVAYCSRKHASAEIYSEIYDKEPLVIIWAFKEYYPLQEGSPHIITIIYD
jgi:hypothetical protein